MTTLPDIQKKLRRAGENVPLHELQRLREGGKPSLSTPRLAIDLIATLPPRATKRSRVPAMALAAVLALSGIADAQMPMPEAPSGLYEGASGTHYTYDLNTPAGQIGYATDPAAQIRDSIMSPMPGPQLDRGLGQHGGGIDTPRRERHEHHHHQRR